MNGKKYYLVTFFLTTKGALGNGYIILSKRSMGSARYADEWKNVTLVLCPVMTTKRASYLFYTVRITKNSGPSGFIIWRKIYLKAFAMISSEP